MSHRPDKEEIDLQYEAERTEPGKSPSVMPYLAVLVVAVFQRACSSSDM